MPSIEWDEITFHPQTSAAVCNISLMSSRTYIGCNLLALNELELIPVS